MERDIKHPTLFFVYSCGILSFFFFVDYDVRKVKLMSPLLLNISFLFVRVGCGTLREKN